MTFKNFVCKGILVFAGLLLLGWLGKYIYMVDGEIDWFRFAGIRSASGNPTYVYYNSLALGFIRYPWNGCSVCDSRRCIWLFDCSLVWNPGGMVYGGIPNQQDCGNT